MTLLEFCFLVLSSFLSSSRTSSSCPNSSEEPDKVDRSVGEDCQVFSQLVDIILDSNWFSSNTAIVIKTSNVIKNSLIIKIAQDRNRRGLRDVDIRPLRNRRNLKLRWWWWWCWWWSLSSSTPSWATPVAALHGEALGEQLEESQGVREGMEAVLRI